MNVLIVLLGFSMVVAGGFLTAFLWAVRSGQYADKHTPSVRMLFDDDDRSKNHLSSTHSS
jgi:cbb3-type cytochrome oxidase maturation protein